MLTMPGVPSRLRLSQKTMSCVRRFTASEAGSLTIFTLFIFIVMLMITGMAVDLMRFEARRVALQSTLDRAVLAAADMDQTLSPTAVVTDYFDKAGLDGVTVQAHEDTGLNYRTVNAMGAMQMNTIFMQLLGIYDLEAPAVGGATEGMTEVEISLVVDVSGSMGNNSRLDNLKVAAKEFVNTVIDTSGTTASPDQTHISIVPFANQVNARPTIASYFNYSGEHNHSHCVDWQTADFTSPAVSLTTEVRQTGHFDPRTRNLGTSSSFWPACDTDTSRHILPFESDIPTLETYIDNLTDGGWTSMELGAKWGAALLDPSTQAVATGMVANGQIDNDFDGRPMAYNAENLIKVMIIMSDGANTNQWYLNDEFQSGLSNIWYHADDDIWTYHDEDMDWATNASRKYWYEHPSNGDTWASAPYDSADSVQLTWPQVWEKASVDWVREHVIEDMANSDSESQTWEGTVYTRFTNASNAKDDRAAALCLAARQQGVTIYTIGFETDADGDAALLRCASGPSYFYNATGTQISDVFASIAANITQLKLTY